MKQFAKDVLLFGNGLVCVIITQAKGPFMFVAAHWSYSPLASSGRRPLDRGTVPFINVMRLTGTRNNSWNGERGTLSSWNNGTLSGQNKAVFRSKKDQVEGKEGENEGGENALFEEGEETVLQLGEKCIFISFEKRGTCSPDLEQSSWNTRVVKTGV